MKILIDISKDKYDKIMSMDWKNRYFYDEELKAIHDGKVLGQEPCDDCISRQQAIDAIDALYLAGDSSASFRADAEGDTLIGKYQAITALDDLQPVTPQQNMGHCKDCKYFEYDSVAKVNGIPLIVAHEICKRWGDGCKSKEDGYCFLFEPQESEG